MSAIATLPGLTCHFEGDPPSESDGVIAVISHARSSAAPALRMGSPTLRISVPDAARKTGQFEVWRTGRDVSSGHHDGLVYSYDECYLFGAGRIRHDENYAAAAENIYLKGLDLIGRMGYPEVARVWNIVGGITAPVRQPVAADRYGEFCQARARAFRQRGLVPKDMPAATGIGGHDGHTTVYFLATRCGITRIENPRQVPAYEYPDCYGAQAPSFARAAFVRSSSGFGDLFVSGTASILGHETVHHGDAELQTRTTVENIAELVSGENLRRHGIDAEIALRNFDCVKVYVKRPRDLETIRGVCAAAFGASSQVVYTIADICRDDLLVEIEGFVSVPTGDRRH